MAMKESSRAWLLWLACATFCVPALAHLVTLAFVLGSRVNYAMDLEWLESAQLYQGFRIAHGLPIYGPAHLGFMACPYPPLYSLLIALVGSVFGFDYWNGRGISDAAIAVAIGVQVRMVWTNAASRRVASWAALGVAASWGVLYVPLRGYPDMARVDSTALAFVLLGAARVAPLPAFGLVGSAAPASNSSTPHALRHHLLTAALLVASVYTKQNSAILVASIVGLEFLRSRRSGAWLAGLAFALAVLPLVWLQWTSQGWFFRWMTVAKNHPMVLANAPPAIDSMLKACPVLPLIPLATAFLFRVKALGALAKYWLGLLVVAFPMCALPIIAQGGAVNSLLTIATLGWLTAFLLVQDLLRLSARRGRLEVGVLVAEYMVYAAYAFTLSLSTYRPMDFAPDEAQLRGVREFHAFVRGLDGDVAIPMFPFAAIRDGKTGPQMSLVAYFDATQRSKIPGDMPEGIQRAAPKWAVAFGYEVEGWIPVWLGPTYVLDRNVENPTLQTFMRAGSPPLMLYRRLD
jgi:hypothetical protein